MGAEDSWAADTVALGGRKSESEPARPEPLRPRAPKRKRSTPASRVVVTCAAAFVVVAALAAILGSHSKAPKATIPDLADPAPRVTVKQPIQLRRRGLRPVAKSHFLRKAKEKREPKGNAATRELDKPEPIGEAVPSREPVPDAEPALPTSPTTEFGL